jgi:hypothetical protein
MVAFLRERAELISGLAQQLTGSVALVFYEKCYRSSLIESERMISYKSNLRYLGAALWLASSALGCPDIANADLGPKPTASFSITVDNGAHMTRGILLMCEKEDCSDAAPLEQVGPQHFGCSGARCDALAYGFSPYLQLQLTLSDGRKLISQVFKKEAFDATFIATATGGRLYVEEQRDQVGQ